MNVLNVHELERELNRYASAAIYPQAAAWVRTVARNHMLAKLSEKEVYANFRVYDARKLELLMPKPAALPQWAKDKLKDGETLHWFNPLCTRRRVLWQTLQHIVMWYNTFRDGDTRLRRCDRINFDTAAKAAAFWFKDVNENIWEYVKDMPPVIKTYEHGIHWVRLVTSLHFEREGRLMKHCVGNGGYFESWRRGQREYYSLRDKGNKPHATIETNSGDKKNVRVLQCKGPTNGRPSKNFQPYIRRFFNDMRWAIDGDQSNID
jgi:hypothetical protein